jgi:predicted SAM-dependent methyltransferase
MKRLNIGCGKKNKNGYINLDLLKLPNVDVVHDLNQFPWPFKKNEFDEILCDNVLEHLNDTIKPIEELWRITKNKGIIKIWVPLYPSIGCFADPTHKQTFTYMSFNYFREEDGLNYYSCARFKIKKRKIIFSKYLRIIEKLVNINEFFQKAYYRVFSNIISPSFLYIELESIKNS